MGNLKKLAEEMRNKPIKVMSDDVEETPVEVDIRGFPEELLKGPGKKPKKQFPNRYIEEEPRGELKKVTPVKLEQMKELDDMGRAILRKIEQAKKDMDDAKAEKERILAPVQEKVKPFQQKEEEADARMKELGRQLFELLASKMDKKGAEIIKEGEHLILVIDAFKTFAQGKGTDIAWQFDKFKQIVEAMGVDLDKAMKSLENAKNGATRYVVKTVKEIHRFYENENIKKEESIKTGGFWETIKKIFYQVQTSIHNFFQPVDQYLNDFQMKMKELKKLTGITGSVITRSFN